VRLLHFDCFSGISGDMALGALVDAGLPVKDLARALKAVPAKGYALRANKVMRGGLHATKVTVAIKNGFGSPLRLSRIHQLIAASRVPPSVKELGHKVFEELARAEGLAHRMKASEVRFHEVGVVDSLVDVLGCLLGCHLLGVNRVTASPVNLGTGVIASAHGVLPVPGPAVAHLSRGLPVYSTGPNRELTTPTGIALLRTLAGEFGGLPLMRGAAVGYGAGTADTEGWPNVLRVFIGDSVGGEPVTDASGSSEPVIQIETNLDDFHPQAYETVMERLFRAGALDVTLTPVIMKRGRPGVVLTILATAETAAEVAQVVLEETSSLGVRIQEIDRWVLPRRIHTVRVQGGPVRVKVAQTRQGRTKAAPEYQDCKRIADRSGRPVQEVLEAAMVAYHNDRRIRRKK
jgi:pyridinium-3,5-bisthiocarboxylic acid mononucleotide nickel chelatase